MSISANAGPLIVFGQANPAPGSGVGQAEDYNPHAGPSLYFQGLGIMDPRYPFAYQPGGSTNKTYGWYGTSQIAVLDAVVPTKAVGAIAAAANVVGGTPMVLVSSAGAGILVGQSVVNSTTGATVTGLLAIGTASGAIAFGQSGGNNFWDPTKLLSRTVAITAAAGASGTVVFTVRGYDVYGYPMSEAITAAANTQTAGKKAFKYIASVTPATTDAQNYSVDTTDVIGLGLAANSFAFTQIYFGNPATPANNLVTAATGFLAGVTTSPATTTTGDVRGTYALQSASDGTKRLTIFVSPQVATLATTAGLVGVTQV